MRKRDFLATETLVPEAFLGLLALAARVKRGEVQGGLDGTEVRAGLIGEIGCSWPLDPVERRALRAAATAQRLTGAAISVHPGRHPDACGQILDVLEGAGADLSRVVLCHMDRTHPDGDGIEALTAIFHPDGTTPHPSTQRIR